MQSADFYLDDEEESLEKLYMTVLEGFFSTALNANETKARFQWIARVLYSQQRPGASDSEKMRLLVSSLDRLVDDKAIRWECTRIAKQQGYTRRRNVKLRRENSADDSTEEEAPKPETALPNEASNHVHDSVPE